MPTKSNPIGPTGKRLYLNLQAMRQQLGLSKAEVSRRTEELGRPLSLDVLTKIEQGRRAVDVDDLVTFALILERPPNQLMLPGESDLDTRVDLTPTTEMSAAEAWDWATERPDWGSQEFSPELFPLWDKLREAHAVIREVVNESGHSWRDVVEAVRLAGHYVVIKKDEGETDG